MRGTSSGREGGCADGWGGGPGETVTVVVRTGGGLVRLEVADRGGPGAPCHRPTAMARQAAGGSVLLYLEVLVLHDG